MAARLWECAGRGLALPFDLGSLAGSRRLWDACRGLRSRRAREPGRPRNGLFVDTRRAAGRSTSLRCGLRTGFPENCKEMLSPPQPLRGTPGPRRLPARAGPAESLELQSGTRTAGLRGDLEARALPLSLLAWTQAPPVQAAPDLLSLTYSLVEGPDHTPDGAGLLSSARSSPQGSVLCNCWAVMVSQDTRGSALLEPTVQWKRRDSADVPTGKRLHRDERAVRRNVALGRPVTMKPDPDARLAPLRGFIWRGGRSQRPQDGKQLAWRQLATFRRQHLPSRWMSFNCLRPPTFAQVSTSLAASNAEETTQRTHASGTFGFLDRTQHSGITADCNTCVEIEDRKVSRQQMNCERDQLRLIRSMLVEDTDTKNQGSCFAGPSCWIPDPAPPPPVNCQFCWWCGIGKPASTQSMLSSQGVLLHSYGVPMILPAAPYFPGLIQKVPPPPGRVLPPSKQEPAVDGSLVKFRDRSGSPHQRFTS
ncbi:uncharacterized protein LOC119241953 [Talpa occidentalis]|uniref:uncharacterized protein LOC119241953 n=1 Tax=Talpa occidentalis TaxID=50954 RepID=UPI0023F62245|nr:uncharacterized protein LOC119241953 [Talpa occidentalis]